MGASSVSEAIESQKEFQELFRNWTFIKEVEVE